MLNRAPYGAYAVDMSQVIVFWNRSAERIVGFKADDAIGRRCYEVLQSLPEQGTVPVCMEGCPAIRLAREGRVPPVVQVRMRCASGRRKRVTVTPMTLSAAQAGEALLVHLFHEEADEARLRRVASTLYSVLTEGKLPAQPTDSTGDLARGEASPLTAREVEVLRLLAVGLETKEIADELRLSPHTIRNHIRNARQKMRAKSRLGAVLAAQRRGLL